MISTLLWSNSGKTLSTSGDLGDLKVQTANCFRYFPIDHFLPSDLCWGVNQNIIALRLGRTTVILTLGKCHTFLLQIDRTYCLFFGYCADISVFYILTEFHEAALFCFLGRVAISCFVPLATLGVFCLVKRFLHLSSHFGQVPVYPGYVLADLYHMCQ